jgi:hypothetical protein
LGSIYLATCCWLLTRSSNSCVAKELWCRLLQLDSQPHARSGSKSTEA